MFQKRKGHGSYDKKVSSLSYQDLQRTKMLDADECKASLPVCDTNAICQNTPDSYICACKPGVIADGRTCTGKRVYSQFIP